MGQHMGPGHQHMQLAQCGLCFGTPVLMMLLCVKHLQFLWNETDQLPGNVYA